jgi:two-component system nitrate/nitrite response regulator NarL
MRILLCDDHRLLLECIAAVFQGHGHTVEQALSPEEAIELMIDHGADVCVLDLGFPRGDGGDAVAHVRHASPGTKIVVFTATSEHGALERARESGADGYVSKEESVARLVEVVECVFRRGGVGAADWDSRVAPALRPADPTPHFLTPRELQALEGLVRGKNTSELARWMGVRESTVSTHVQTVLTKLGVHSRLEAVAFATAERLVTIDH